MELQKKLCEIWSPYAGGWSTIVIGWKHYAARRQYKRTQDRDVVIAVNELLEQAKQQRVAVPSTFAVCSVQTYRLISKRLLEALSSPNEYIREWGKLVMEEKNEKQANRVRAANGVAVGS